MAFRLPSSTELKALRRMESRALDDRQREDLPKDYKEEASLYYKFYARTGKNKIQNGAPFYTHDISKGENIVTHPPTIQVVPSVPRRKLR